MAPVRALPHSCTSRSFLSSGLGICVAPLPLRTFYVDRACAACKRGGPQPHMLTRWAQPGRCAQHIEHVEACAESTSEVEEQGLNHVHFLHTEHTC